MNRQFQQVSLFFFLGFGFFYLSSDFLLHQTKADSETLKLIYETFDMPFFFSAGMYFLSSLHQFLEKRYELSGLNAFFWILALLWTIFLLYLNIGFESLL